MQDSYATGISVDLVRGEHRSLVANIGAAEHFTIEDFQKNEKNRESLSTADYVYVEGFFLTKRVEIAKYILNYCKRNNKVFVFNISGVYMCELQPEDMAFFGQECDVLFGNRKEYSALSKTINFAGDPEDYAIDLSKNHPKKDYLPYGKITVMTNGSKSVHCAHSGGIVEILQAAKVEKKDIRDTTGAGDSFVSGFLAGLFNNKKPLTCLEWGCWVSGKIIQEYGCTVPNYAPDGIRAVDSC